MGWRVGWAGGFGGMAGFNGLDGWLTGWLAGWLNGAKNSFRHIMASMNIHIQICIRHRGLVARGGMPPAPCHPSGLSMVSSERTSDPIRCKARQLPAAAVYTTFPIKFSMKLFTRQNDAQHSKKHPKDPQRVRTGHHFRSLWRYR